MTKSVGSPSARIRAPDHRIVRRVEPELADRIAPVGVDPERDHQHAPARSPPPPAQPVSSAADQAAKSVPCGSGRLRLNPSPSPSPRSSAWPRKYGYSTIGSAWMFTTCTSPRRVEDRLRPVAVVIVDVEHADPRRPLQPQPLGRHRRVVDEAVSPGEARARMVPGRTAEREGRPRAAMHQRRRGQRHVVARLDRLPRPRDEGCASVHGIEPEQPVDVGGRDVRAQPRHRPDERHRRPRPSRRRPERPGARQELQVVRRMHPPRRREVVLVRPQHRPEPDLPHPRQHDLGPPRHLEGRHDGARTSARHCRHARHGAANRPSASAAPGWRAEPIAAASPGASAATGHCLNRRSLAGSASRAGSSRPPASTGLPPAPPSRARPGPRLARILSSA